MKKVLALVLAAVMVMALCGAALASTITVDNVKKGETYTVYKVLDYTSSGDAYSYFLSSTDYAADITIGSETKTRGEWLTGVGFTFTASADGSKYTVSNTASLTDGAALAEELKTILPALTLVETQVATDDSDITFTGLGTGYYFVTSSVGALCSLQTFDAQALVLEKNSYPGEDKKQAVGTAAPTDASEYVDEDQQVQVGDHVWYQIEVTDGKGTSHDIVITDTMSNALTFDNNITVFKSAYDASTTSYGAETSVASSATTWTQTDPTGSDTFTFKVTFDDEYVSTLNEKDKVFIRFSATVNQNAVTDSDAAKERNTSDLDYQEHHETDYVEVVTYKFQLDKTKNAAANYADLLGAKFELYRGSVADGNKIYFTAGTAEGGVPVLNVAPSTATGAFTEIQLTDDSNDAHYLNSNKVIIKGLDLDTYILRETKAPDGYNAAADQTVASSTLVAIDGTITDVEAAITGDVGVVTVVNEAGTVLPSTGGIGTTIFYVCGLIMVLGASIILIARRRADAE